MQPEYRDGESAITPESFVALARRVWPREYDAARAALALEKTINIGAWVGDRLVGSVRVLTDGYFFATVSELMVDPEYQRRGIGRELMRRALDVSPGGRLFLGAQPGNEPFFERAGFTRGLVGFVGRRDDLLRLPSDLPVPVDDGMASHLVGLPIPTISLPSTTGQRVDLSALAGRTVVYCYPRTGRPDQELPKGWNLIPGARGCTPQSCAFRDHHRELQALDARVFGLSTQDTDYQREAAERLHLPFALLSDARLEFTSAMRLPTFEVESIRLLKRLTLVIRDGTVEQVFYPVFPPDENARQVLSWLLGHRAD